MTFTSNILIPIPNFNPQQLLTIRSEFRPTRIRKNKIKTYQSYPSLTTRSLEQVKVPVGTMAVIADCCARANPHSGCCCNNKPVHFGRSRAADILVVFHRCVETSAAGRATDAHGTNVACGSSYVGVWLGRFLSFFCGEFECWSFAVKNLLYVRGFGTHEKIRNWMSDCDLLGVWKIEIWNWVFVEWRKLYGFEYFLEK